MFDWTLWGTACRNKQDRAGGINAVPDIVHLMKVRISAKFKRIHHVCVSAIYTLPV